MRVGPSPVTGVLIRRGKFGHRDTGKKACEDRGRDWSDPTISRGTPKTGHQKVRRSREGSLHRAFVRSTALPKP